MTKEQEQLMELLLRHEPRKADVIVLLAGDRFHRIPKVAELYHSGFAPQVVVTSSAHNYAYGSLPSHVLVRKLQSHDIPEVQIIWEETAAHTRGEAESTMRLAVEHGWNSLILVTTEYHQYRAFLTFLKAMRDMNVNLELIMVPTADIPSFQERTRDELLAQEFERIELYGAKGDVATHSEGVIYLLGNNGTRTSNV
jgi:uncharacterized SAM-binding protein YcdF (DUF218 family)